MRAIRYTAASFQVSNNDTTGKAAWIALVPASASAPEQGTTLLPRREYEGRCGCAGHGPSPIMGAGLTD